MTAEKAYAKINLFLDVISRRDDGFHGIKSVMHSLSLSDELIFEFSESETAEIDLHINGDDSLPVDEGNLIVRAAKKYLEKTGITLKIEVTLEKNIPTCAGLAGGSSDAAATLRALNRYCEERLGEEEMLSLAAELGSDVPYCLFGGTSLCLDRGETVIPFDTDLDMYFAVVKGEGSVCTPEAYKKLDELYSDFDGTRKTQGNEILTELLSGLEKGGFSESSLYNIFEEAVINELPEVESIKNRLLALGAGAALMSGSGPSVYGIFKTAEEAEAAAKTLSDEGFFAVFARSVN